MAGVLVEEGGEEDDTTIISDEVGVGVDGLNDETPR